MKSALALATLLCSLPISAQEAQNTAPVVQIVAAGPFAAETLPISYLLFDSEEDAGTLRYSLYAYPDNKLPSVGQIQTFAIMVADEQDLLNSKGTGDFAEGQSGADLQTYTWDDPGPELRGRGFAALNRVMEGNFYLYLVADDGVNEPVFSVSAEPVHINRSAPVTAVSSIGWAQVKTARP